MFGLGSCAKDRKTAQHDWDVTVDVEFFVFVGWDPGFAFGGLNL